ncbi:MAG: Gfo/Idh/MocA family oxidoreductase [Kiritimatiellia bacterium]
MSDSKLKVAVVGCGMIANSAHIPAWQTQKDVEITGVMDAMRDRAESTACKHGIAGVYDDVDRMLKELSPDVVSICTPAGFHKDQVIAALRSGAHVFCEKPLTISSVDAEEIFRVAEESKRQILVGQSMRFYNQISAAKEFVTDGQLGDMYCADVARLRRRGIPTYGTFHIKELSGGGVLYDLGVHMLDTVLWLMGNPRVVAVSGTTYAKIGTRNEGLITSSKESGAFAGGASNKSYDGNKFDVEDFAAAFLRLENGATINLKVCWAANIPDSAGGIMIMGTEGGLSFDPRVLDLRLIRNMGRYQVDVTPKIMPPEPDHPFYAHWNEVAHFIRVIKGEEEVCVKKEEVLNVIRSLEAIYRSAEEGCEVRIS